MPPDVRGPGAPRGRFEVPEHEGGTFARGVRAVRRYLVTPAARALESGRQAQEAVAMQATVTDVMTANVVAVRKDTPSGSHRAARHVEGAAAVRDRLSCPPPARGTWPGV
jgi:hypothetical protein